MSAGQVWALVGLGLFHGVNPAMGWMLAVSRGLQERSRRALLLAVSPIAAGHAASVVLFALAITMTGSVLASRWFTVILGVVVVGAGAWLLISRGHHQWHGLRPSTSHLAGWSFLMASMHGAGLMMVPVLAGDLPQGRGVPGGGHDHAAASAAPLVAAPETGPDLADATVLGLVATGVHTAAMFFAVAVVALVVYDFFGVHALRWKGVTMDRVWAFTLVVSGLFVIVH
ncbi:cell wall anchor protein [Spiractinospora alimapuensis]|uniref:cell wall anchor protein n=1 Tax=Spiractinospora alimapuensis TaxID=2820884 RepID=UPI001F49098C|nr:cell wall anchor protein [Spiractinospora alimapuensis]QVQ50732.1 cell wall anchor protein [Spiractinospora alimapuensis]